MSDPKDKTPHPDHPHKDEFEFELHETAAKESPHGPEHAPDEHGAAEPHPLDELGIQASSEDFHFTGPADELDFTEPADFTFPTEHAEAGADSSAEIAASEHAGLEHFFGGDEAAHHEAVADEEMVAEVAPAVKAAEGEAGEVGVEEEPTPKPKRELPAWVRALEWVTVGLLAAIGLIAPFVAIIWIADPKTADTVTLIVNICFPMLLLLVPYALWRSSRRWTKPAMSALYTVLLAVSAAALIGGSWVEARELSRMKWEFNKSRVAAGKPAPKFFASPPDAPADAGQK